jgi:hypothetical protein
MSQVEMRERERTRLRRSGLTAGKVLERAAKAGGVSPEDVKGWGRSRGQSEARALFSKWMVEDLGYSGALVAGMLGVTKMAVWKAVIRGRKIEAERKLARIRGSG